MLCREGYLFRQGALGAGYYRKDVVRRYCASAAAAVPSSSPASSSTCATASGRDAAASGDASAVGQQQRQEQQEQQEAAEEEARQYIQRLLQAPPSMHSVVASTSTGLLFTSSLGPSDSSIRVWRLPTHSGSSGGTSSSSGGSQQPELHRTLTGHSAPVLSLALSLDGRLLFSGSYDQTIRVWSTADWHCLRVLKGHGGGVRALAVAPDGGTLYSAAADNTIRVRACPAAFLLAVLAELQTLTAAGVHSASLRANHANCVPCFCRPGTPSTGCACARCTGGTRTPLGPPAWRCRQMAACWPAAPRGPLAPAPSR